MEKIQANMYFDVVFLSKIIRTCLFTGEGWSYESCRLPPVTSLILGPTMLYIHLVTKSMCS